MGAMTENDWSELATEWAFKNPKVGDRFHEMYSFWVYVVAVRGNWVGIMEAAGPCELPKDGKVSFMTKDDFREKYAYGTIPGYSIRFHDHDNDVEGWV